PRNPAALRPVDAAARSRAAVGGRAGVAPAATARSRLARAAPAGLVLPAARPRRDTGSARWQLTPVERSSGERRRRWTSSGNARKASRPSSCAIRSSPSASPCAATGCSACGPRRGWACPTEAADAYAKAVAAADFEAPGDGDIIGKVLADFAEKNIAISEAELRAELLRWGEEARRQLAPS